MCKNSQLFGIFQTELVFGLFFFLSSPNMASQIISFFYLQERMEPETSVIWLCSKNNWGNTLILSTFLKDYKFYLKFWDKVTP